MTQDDSRFVMTTEQFVDRVCPKSKPMSKHDSKYSIEYRNRMVPLFIEKINEMINQGHRQIDIAKKVGIPQPYLSNLKFEDKICNMRDEFLELAASYFKLELIEKANEVAHDKVSDEMGELRQKMAENENITDVETPIHKSRIRETRHIRSVNHSVKEHDLAILNKEGHVEENITFQVKYDYLNKRFTMLTPPDEFYPESGDMTGLELGLYITKMKQILDEVTKLARKYFKENGVAK